MAQYLSYRSNQGVMIAGISKGSRAAEDGLETGDILVELGGRRIDNLNTIQDALARSRSSVKAKIFRNRKFLTLTLHLR
jgi:S1-C subfamily serine protease